MAFQLSQKAPAAKLPCRVVKPHQKNPYYVGREEVRERLQRTLAPRLEDTHCQKSYALCGLGGVGKTQTALNYVFEYMEDFQAVLWAPANSQAKLLESFAGFAVELGLVKESDSNQTGKDMLKKWFEVASKQAGYYPQAYVANDICPAAVPWLLIFDNADGADKEDLFEEFWPAGGRGSILITSRDITLHTNVGGEILSGLTEASAVDLLIKLTRPQWPGSDNDRPKHEEDAAHHIVARVGFLPLGITQAARIIINDSSLLADFLEAYNDRELILNSETVKLVNKPGERYSFNLSTVWNMSFETLERDQQEFLNVISFLDPDRIQLQLLCEGSAKAVKNGCGSLTFMDDIRKVTRCKGPVVRSSLVTQNEKLRELWMHRLVQQSCHLRMTAADRQASFDMAFAMVKYMWPVPARDNRHRVDLWPTQQAYFAHVQSLAQFYEESQEEPRPLCAAPTFAELLCDASL